MSLDSLGNVDKEDEEVTGKEDEVSPDSQCIMDKEDEELWNKLCARNKKEDTKRREKLRLKMKTFIGSPA